MRAAIDPLEGLIQFQGLNFRATAINCGHCGWSGTGGALEVPGLAASGEPVVYACPDCQEVVAVHNGLNDQEVMQEMEKIRQILAREMSATCKETIKDSAGDKVPLEFAAIRTQIRTEVASPFDPESGDTGSRKVEQSTDLDFESIRARLGAIA